MKRAALAALMPSIALACSGPGAGELIERATLVGFGTLVLSIIFTILIWQRHRPRVLRVAATLCVIHPGIWISATSGDCGITRTYASVAMVMLHFALWAITSKPAAPSSKSP